MKKQLVSIILPIHNQSDHIAAIIPKYQDALDNAPLDYELVLVVNGSRDNSLELCHDFAKKYDSIRVFESNPGWGSAVKHGLKMAQGEIICFTNSARTSPQDLVLSLLYAVANPNAVIKANRKIRDSLRRRIGSLLYNIECRTLFDLSNWDVNGTPKVFPKKFKKLFNLSRTDDLIDLEFNVICRQEDYPMLEIPTFSPRRHGGRSTTGLSSAFGMYWGAYAWKNSLKNESNTYE